MVKNKIIIISILIFLGVAVSLANADDGKAVDFDTKVSQSKSNTPTQQETYQQEVLDWFKRTNFAVEVSSDKKPSYFMETIQPLLGTQDKDIVLFNQSRVSARSEHPTYNIGFGTRKIFKDSYLLGGNIFYDYRDLHKHSRGGVGLEAISDRGLEARINSYIAISREHLVNEDANNFYYEKVANGLDWELGSPFPYLPFLRMYGGGYWYNFAHFKNKYGWPFVSALQRSLFVLSNSMN